MRKESRLTNFIKRGEGDARITPVHMSFLIALFCYWEENGWQIPIRASRRALMKLARIHSTSTYHKCVKELSAFGYIDYKPSFNPRGSDFIILLNMDAEERLMICIYQMGDEGVLPQ